MKRVLLPLIMSLLVSMLLVTAASANELVVIAEVGVGKNFPELFERFTEETGIPVKLQLYPFRELFQAIEVQVASGGGPDVIHVDSPLTASYAVRGYLLPLDDYIDVANSGWTEAGIAAGSWQGRLYSAPFETSTQVLFYNRDLFEQAGIEPPGVALSERWTWEQVVEAARKIQAQANPGPIVNKWGLLFEQISRPYQMLPLPQSLGGGSGVSPDGLSVRGYLNNEGWVEALTFYHDLFNTWNVSPKGVNPDQTFDMFVAGNVAMIVAGTWQLPAAEQGATFNWGMAPHPYFASGEPVTPTGSWHWGINANSQNVEAAVKFIEFMTLNEDVIEHRFKTVGQLVPHRKMMEIISNDPAYDVFPRNIYRIVADELSTTAQVRPVTPAYLEWEDIVNNTFEDVRNGADPKRALDAAVSRLDRLMARYR